MRTYKRKNVLNECIEPIEGVLGLCRLCLQDAKDNVPIFANKNDICALLATRIMICVGYEITHDDCLPNAICIECHNELNRYYEFRKKCDSTYHKLKNHLLAVQATKKANELSVKQDEQKALVDNTSVCPISQSVCSISQSDCSVSQSVCSISQSDYSISQSVCSISQSVCPISQSVCSISQSDCSISQSDCPISQSVCPISQSVCSISQSDCSISQSVCPISQSVCSISQSVCSVNQSDIDVQTIYPVNQSVCAASQSTNQSESTDVQAVYPNCPVSQSVTSLVSNLVTMSRDQLILAFEKPLEIVQAELHQNGFDNAVNGDALIDGAVLNKGVEVKSQEPITIQTEAMEVSLDVKEFLSAILLEMGALKTQQDEVQLTEKCRTIQIETGDGELITLELVQIEEEEQKTTTNKKKKVKRKATNEVTKQQKDERPRCSECGRQFATRAVLRRHARTHTGERPFRCARCGLSFNQREVLTRHELVHRDVRPFACTRCPKSFTQRNALAAHARRHDAPDAASVTLHHCSQCPKKFLHASGLSRHARSHAGRVASCAHCARRFVDDSSLRRHVRLKHEPHPPPKPRDMHYELLTPLLAPTSGS